jgi:hypothetical protein
MSHPFQTISPRNTIVFTLVSSIATLSIFTLLNIIGRSLTIPDISPLGIISLEFALTDKNAVDIVQAWKNTNALDSAIYLQWLDFLFIAAYSTMFGLLCILATRWLAKFDPRWLWLGVGLAWGQFAAALFDIVENLCLFPFLYGVTNNLLPLALLAAVSAGLKFILIGLGLLYFLGSVIVNISAI